MCGVRSIVWMRSLVAAGLLVCLSVRAAQKAYPKEFRDQMFRYAQEQTWVRNPEKNATKLNRVVLAKAVEASRVYYLNHQKAEGNFVYEYDLLLNTTASDDNDIRQAGALWGLSSLLRDRPTLDTRHAVIRGLDFYFKNSRPLPCGKIAPIYPGKQVVKTGAVALTCLAIIELNRKEEAYLTKAGRGYYDSWLSQYIEYLQHMELDNGSWGSTYLIKPNERDAEPSPYYDGESLLAYCKAARYMGYKDLVPKIEAIAPQLAERYTVEAWKEDPDSQDTRGFFQWGCMAFAEYVEAGWANSDLIADAAMSLAWWNIHQHRVALRKGNTAYAAEGLLAAYRIARHRNDRRAMKRLSDVVKQILCQVIPWQVGGPLAEESAFLRRQKRLRPEAHGGVMNRHDAGSVRIDVVQHYTHALLMALELLYPDTDAKLTPPPKKKPRK